jgi:hypothetical protein
MVPQVPISTGPQGFVMFQGHCNSDKEHKTESWNVQEYLDAWSPWYWQDNVRKGNSTSWSGLLLLSHIFIRF